MPLLTDMTQYPGNESPSGTGIEPAQAGFGFQTGVSTPTDLDWMPMLTDITKYPGNESPTVTGIEPAQAGFGFQTSVSTLTDPNCIALSLCRLSALNVIAAISAVFLSSIFQEPGEFYPQYAADQMNNIIYRQGRFAGSAW